MISADAQDCLVVKDGETVTYYLLNRELIYSYVSDDKRHVAIGSWMTAENNTILYRFPEDKEKTWKTVSPQEEVNQVISWLADVELFKKVNK